MNFNAFQQKAWSDHGSDPAGVSARLPEGMKLLETPADLAAFVRLLVHVEGEHLGRWGAGLERLGELRLYHASLLQEAGAIGALDRAERVLRLCKGQSEAVDDLLSSEKIRVLAVAAGALAGQSRSNEGAAFFREAVELASVGLAAEDPAHRELAVNGNNLAATLAEKAKRSPEEDALMLLAAEAARRHWELAGTWLHVERAEYRLALCQIAAGNADEAVKHAEFCLEICAAHEAPPLEVFFGFEALALSERAAGRLDAFRKAVGNAKEAFDRLPAEEKPWCQESLRKLSALV